jgi:hypothetical protein
MKLQINVTAALVNSRMLTSGDNKGETKHSVSIFGVAEDGIPATFAIYGLASASEAQAVAAKYPAGTRLAATVAPREPYFVDQGQLSVIGK